METSKVWLMTSLLSAATVEGTTMVVAALVRGGACFLLHRSCLEAVVRRAWVDRDWLDGDLG
ncbi:hypothetical protein E4U15_005011 [Claviceps sp. LM218 group G6]|nr:hypothetical protein E4U15_005011 [Claviceps sp. LM218 group G6]KAG6112523.1 hypothetical protein E4U14_002037 [Claviceps sp. LM454 group G7]